MARNTRKYPKKEEEDLRDNIQQLKSHIRRLQKTIRELKSENATLLEAWAKTEYFLEEVTDGVPLEEILTYEQMPKRNIRKKNQKVQKQKSREDSMKTKEEVRQKWAKWRKENL